jgi:hypothetical protein
MKETHIHLQWSPECNGQRLRTGVSLHSHTLHSRESLDFIYRIARHSSVIRRLIRHGEARCRAFYGACLDLRKGWWTPPAGATQAYALECEQLQAFGLNALVSLTDHDNIHAAESLHANNAMSSVPISVEWTVPFRNAFLHLGVHNLPPLRARSLMTMMQEFTARPSEPVLKSILAGLNAIPGSLLVLNHPMWDEKGVGQDVHHAAMLNLLALCGEYLHAVELNGLRPWHENKQAMVLARTWSKPIVSGGDRHVLEPNATLNLTNATSFSEFAEEIRHGHSHVLIASHYRKPHSHRLIQNALEAFRPYKAHELGWEAWTDRVFYEFDGGMVRPLSEIWGVRPPSIFAAIAALIRFADRKPLRQFLRVTGPWAEQVVL